MKTNKNNISDKKWDFLYRNTYGKEPKYNELEQFKAGYISSQMGGLYGVLKKKELKSPKTMAWREFHGNREKL